MTGNLTPQPPTATFTRSVRVGVVLYALALVGLGAWNLSTNVPLPWFAVGLSVVSGLLIGVSARRLWRWAGQPRLHQPQQRAVT